MIPGTSAADSGAGAAAAPLPETIEVGTGPSPSFSVIWLHGLGADGHDFEAVVPELGLGEVPAVRFVFPHAPVRPVTLNGGMAMRAWYDIVSLTASREADEAGIAQSTAQVAALIEREEARGVPPERVVLAGFSQGGAIALHAGLRYPRRLAGIMALSSYLLMSERLSDERSDANHDVPLFVAHGEMDPVVPFAAGQATAQKLEALGYPVEWHRYPLPHSVSLHELADIGRWLRARLD